TVAGAWFLWLLSAQEASSITKSSVPSPEVTVPFWLVPSAEFSQALWSTRPDHLCRFRVRFLCNWSLETFPGSIVSATSPVIWLAISSQHRAPRICLRCMPTTFHLDNQRQADL